MGKSKSEKCVEVNRDFKGIWIPREIWLADDLDIIEKFILAEIDSLDVGENHCTASNNYLSKFLQCSESKVTKAVSKLIKKGYIEVVNFDGRHRTLKSNLKTTCVQPIIEQPKPKRVYKK